jgi:hypothetical protein
MQAITKGRSNLISGSYRLFLFLSAYAVCLLLLLSKLSLWLDELLDLKGIRDYNFRQLIAFVPVNAGGVPLNYLARELSIHVLGYSRFSARLPSAIFSVLACAGVFWLARFLKLRAPLMAVLIFCLLPLQFRYALESRPYSQALAISVGAMVSFLALLRTPTLSRGISYGLLALAGLYTQPYTLFVFLAHLAWLCALKSHPNRRRLLLLSALPIAVAALAFVPWYLWAAQLWKVSPASSQHYTISPRAILMVLRELVGAGYIGTALILFLAFIGLKSLYMFHDRLFWSLQVVVPILLALVADIAFNYFLAIRQMIFVVAPLSLLAALGLEALALQRRITAAVLGSVLLVTFVFEDIHLFTRPRENWETAAHTLEELSKTGACTMFVPASSVDLYRFFVPQLTESTCLADSRQIAVAIAPQSPASDGLKSALFENGFTKVRDFNPQGPRIELYEHK